MKKLATRLAQRQQNQKGATVIEYALIAALISIIAIAVMTGVGNSVNNVFSEVNSALS